MSLAVAAVSCLFFTSCAVLNTQTGMGALYTSTTDPGAVTSNSVGSKVGVSGASNILGLVVTGDASINAAAKNGGIKKVSHVDVQKSTILGIYSTTKTFVYGD